MPYLFTSESVSEGHPDKLCDRVSDTVLDLFLAQEPEARVACETFATTNRVIIGGEVRASEDKMPGIMDSIESAVRGAIADIGYEQDEFHHAHLEFQNYLHKQSTDIAMGVDSGDNKDEGAGDQGQLRRLHPLSRFVCEFFEVSCVFWTRWACCWCRVTSLATGSDACPRCPNPAPKTLW